MTIKFGTELHDKGTGAYFPLLQGMELRQAQKRLLAALLLQPGLVPTVLRSGIRPDCFPESWRNAFTIATKDPDRGRQIAADPNGDSIIRHLCSHRVPLGHGQALQLADQIMASVRRHNAARANGEEIAAAREHQKGGVG